MNESGELKMSAFDSSSLKMTPSPHLRDRRTSSWIMRQVIIALLIPTAGGVYFFGGRVLLIIAISVGSSVLFEYVYQKMIGRKVMINDFSAVVSGMLIALSLPVTIPIWMILLATFFAIIVIKQLPGGIGKNPFNPAVAARILLVILFFEEFMDFPEPRGATDVFSSATPLNMLSNLAPGVDAVSTATGAGAEIPSLLDLFLGVNLGGNIGDTSTALLLIALIYLIVRRIIEPHIPFLFVLPVAIIALVGSGFDVEFMMQHVLTGTLIFAAVFMVTDYSSTPFNPTGKIIFAIGAGIITVLFRFYSPYPGGVGFGILIMNVFVPILDRNFPPRIYGHKKRRKVNIQAGSRS